MKYASFLALILTIVPAFLVWWGMMSESTLRTVMILGTVLWFGTAPLWIKKEKELPEEPSI